MPRKRGRMGLGLRKGLARGRQVRGPDTLNTHPRHHSIQRLASSTLSSSLGCALGHQPWYLRAFSITLFLPGSGAPKPSPGTPPPSIHLRQPCWEMQTLPRYLHAFGLALLPVPSPTSSVSSSYQGPPGPRSCFAINVCSSACSQYVLLSVCGCGAREGPAGWHARVLSLMALEAPAGSVQGSLALLMKGEGHRETPP